MTFVNILMISMNTLPRERPTEQSAKRMAAQLTSFKDSLEVAQHLPPAWLLFANEFIANGGKKSTAWLNTIGKDDPNVPLTGKKFAYAISRCKPILVNRLVISYIDLRRQELAKLAILDSEERYHAWRVKLQQLRDEAADADQYSAAINAHKLIGEAEGHLDRELQKGLAGKSDRELVEQLAGVLGDKTNPIAQALGIRTVDAIDAEIVEND